MTTGCSGGRASRDAATSGCCTSTWPRRTVTSGSRWQRRPPARRPRPDPRERPCRARSRAERDCDIPPILRSTGRAPPDSRGKTTRGARPFRIVPLSGCAASDRVGRGIRRVSRSGRGRSRRRSRARTRAEPIGRSAHATAVTAVSVVAPWSRAVVMAPRARGGSQCAPCEPWPSDRAAAELVAEARARTETVTETRTEARAGPKPATEPGAEAERRAESAAEAAARGIRRSRPSRARGRSPRARRAWSRSPRGRRRRRRGSGCRRRWRRAAPWRRGPRR